MGKISTLVVIMMYVTLAPLFGAHPLNDLARHTQAESLASRHRAAPLAAQVASQTGRRELSLVASLK